MAANPHSIACLGDHLSKRPAETAGTSKDERPTPSVLEATVEAYRQALAQYLASQDESQLVRAYEAGRKALADGLCVLDMAHVHLQAFEQILEEYCGVWDGSRIRAIANSFFMESLGPYEMTRSALEENVCFIDSRALKLVQRIEQLQAEVSERRELEVRLARLTDHERNRLGRELHDNLGQQLSGVGLLAVTLECELTRLGSSQAALAKRLAEYVEKTQVQLRQVIRGVLPVEVPVSGFVSAVAELVKAYQGVSDVTYGMECSDTIALKNDAQATQLYRIAQEAVHNASRHSGARKVVVSLENGPVKSLTISDNGCGVPAAALESSVGGLQTMRHRAALIQAELTVESQVEGGTTVKCTFC